MNVCNLNYNGEVLILSDLHLREQNFKGRKNYVGELFMYLKYIREYIIKHKVGIVIFLGDIFDNAMNGHESAQILLRFNSWLKSCDVKFFTLQGNHERHSLVKGCPFYYIVDIQSEKVLEDLNQYNLYNSSLRYIHCVDSIVINDAIQIDCLHFVDGDKNYRLDRIAPHYKRIALYHRPIVSNQVRNMVGSATYNALMRNIGNNYVDSSSMLSDYLYAVIGDIHTRIGEFKVGNCLCDICGAIGRTSSLDVHTVVDLPVFNIQGDTISKSKFTLNLLSYEESFDVNIIEKSRVERTRKKDFKKLLETKFECLDVVEYVKNLQLDDTVKTILLSTLEGRNFRGEKLDNIMKKYTV